jgi:hypothetical protein
LSRSKLRGIKAGVSELDSLIGHFVALADKYHIPAPYNRTIYALCKSEFAKPDFKPLTEEQIRQAIKKKRDCILT